MHLAGSIRPVDARQAARVAKFLGVFDGFEGGNFSRWKRAEGVSLVVDPPFPVGVDDDEPIRSQVCPAAAGGKTRWSSFGSFDDVGDGPCVLEEASDGLLVVGNLEIGRGFCSSFAVCLRPHVRSQKFGIRIRR